MTQVQIRELIQEAARLEGIDRSEWSDIAQNETEEGQSVYLVLGNNPRPTIEEFTAPKPEEDKEAFIAAVREGVRRAVESHRHSY